MRGKTLWIPAFVGMSGGGNMMRKIIMLFSGLISLVTLIIVIATTFSHAAPIRIVALGASNTAGKGVAAGAAWPAQLQAMLRAKGIDARVTNAGISGDDTGRMLARVNAAVPAGTALVILDKAASNDRLRGVNTAGNIAAISAQLQSRGIKTIVIEAMHAYSGRQIQSDGTHITAGGHSAVAARLLPQVMAAIGSH
jgi:acyl-CoA thioesterase I